MVISPLVALMKDQVDALSRRNIPATFINSSITGAEQDARLKGLANGKFKIVYIAPERLRNSSFMDALCQQQISLLAVDEAHCISEWGHDFRPDYLHIAQARKVLGSPLTAALTATATPGVQNDIIEKLDLPKETKRIITGFNRPNLSLEVRKTTGITSKLSALDELIRSPKQCAIIVYTGTRRDAEEVAEFAREVSQVKAGHYHAGLTNEKRSEIQEKFVSGRLNLIVATNAFGMGIDRPDVRMVIHYSMPGSLEAYYQEAGRAGRDGILARAVLFYDPQDRQLQEFFIQSNNLRQSDLDAIYHVLDGNGKKWVTLEEFSRTTGLHPVQIKVGLAKLEQAGAVYRFGDMGTRIHLQRLAWNPFQIQKVLEASDQHIKHLHGQLNRMIQYAEAHSCRRKIILRYFGDPDPREAEICCDNCLSGKNSVETQPDRDISFESQKVITKDLSEIKQLITKCACSIPAQLPRSGIAKLLVGSLAGDILQFKIHPLYGCLAGHSRKEILKYVDEMIQDGTLIKGVAGHIEIGQSIPPPIPQTFSHNDSQETLVPGKRVFKAHFAVELGKTKSPGAVLELIIALASTDGNVRRLAASALGKLRDKRAVGPLMELLAHEDKPQVRQYIVKALGKIGDLQAAELLQQIVDDETEMYYTRASAKHALTSLKRSRANSDPQDNPSTSLKLGGGAGDRKTKIENYLSQAHPRPLIGPWDCGWALDFHSYFNGADWSRGRIGELTFRLKYQADFSVIPTLVDYTALLLDQHPRLGQVDLILPVPPSQQREKDPVDRFCHALADRIGIAIEPILTKLRPTLPQKEMKTLAQKRANISGVFYIRRRVQGKRILVVDDLFDSGATLEEITRVLMQAGAKCVCVLTLTRTIHSDT